MSHEPLHRLIQRVVWGKDAIDPDSGDWLGVDVDTDDIEALRRIVPRPGEPYKSAGVFEAIECAGFDGAYWVAMHQETGICTCGHPTHDLAAEDARALNAAFELGRQCGLLEAEG